MRDVEVSAATTERPVEDDRLAAVERWAGERIVPPGEDPAVQLADGTLWRTAFDEALAEIEAGRTSPSAEWRRAYALPLGLQRMLSEPKPHLAGGLELRPHQVDALTGMLAALLGDAERLRREPEDASNGDVELSEEDEELEDEGGPDAVDPALLEAQLRAEAEILAGVEELEEDDDIERGLEESELVPVDVAQTADEDGGDDDEAAPIEDPGVSRRYRFRHPTASGKTVAAAGFVDAARITGVLILTHRRLLVEQFKRDLRDQGYGHRLKDAVLRGARGPVVPPVSVETYAWFIRNADALSRDVYGVVLCDEAHTALGDRTAAAIRRLDTPTYIGMTATDQLLQKHVGDVFPAEIADFPLDEAVKRGVVAPLRSIRVRPGASLKRVKIVGGDFDQQELAAALDHDALNMAAALLYLDRFGNRPGIVYSAGVDHAGRVAAAMKAVGIKAAAVSGRTPPRELATTLAAYERGEINVLVNAQLLAEGWNAPRATVCMHLAPTASRRVYQQRVGRIMRLHRRKEAGVVVDFAESTAPHSDRTVTVHSLLGVDVYQPGALVTPRPPRRRQRWRRVAKPLVRDAGWLVPVTSDPARRREIILRDWKQIAIDRLPVDEQEMWAENAGRKIGSKDLVKLASVLAGVAESTRLLFLATCAAENKNRALRLMALGDLAQQAPSANVFERAVRLVEAAPTWRLDRAQGARTLLLALGDGRVDASDHQVVAWAWRLARVSREAQFRRVTTALENGRDLARGLSGTSGDASVRAAARIAATAVSVPTDVGAALLAVVLSQDPAAVRLLDSARTKLSQNPTGLAAALGSNVPIPRGVRRPASRPEEPKRPKAGPERKPPATPPPTAEMATDASGDGPSADGDPGSKRRRRRRRRSRRRGTDVGAVDTTAVDGAGDGLEQGGDQVVEDAEDAVAGEAVAEVTPAEEAATSSPDDGRRNRRRRRRRAAIADVPAGDGAAVDAPVPVSDGRPDLEAGGSPDVPVDDQGARVVEEALQPAAAVDGADAPEDVPAAPRRRSRAARRPAEVEPVEEAVVAEAPEPAAVTAEEAPPRRRSRAVRRPVEVEPVEEAVVAEAPEPAAVTAEEAPPRRRSRAVRRPADVEPVVEAVVAGEPEPAAVTGEEAPPARSRRPRARVTGATRSAAPAEAAVQAEAAVEAESAEGVAPARRRRTTRAAVASEAAGEAAPAHGSTLDPGTPDREAPAPPRRTRSARKVTDEDRSATPEPGAPGPVTAARPRRARAPRPGAGSEVATGTPATNGADGTQMRNGDGPDSHGRQSSEEPSEAPATRRRGRRIATSVSAGDDAAPTDGPR